jgi:hypothetical protein
MRTSVRDRVLNDLQTWTWPEEDRHLFTAAPWDGGFRWFKADNVVCLEQYQHLDTGRREQVNGRE